LNGGNNYFIKLTVTDDRNGKGNATDNIWLDEADKPAIYFYTPKPVIDTVTVKLDGKATKTIPEIPMGPVITWENVLLCGGKVNYQEGQFDYLFYEGIIFQKLQSHQGWVIEKNSNGEIFIDGEQYSFQSFRGFFGRELEKTGLYPNEIMDYLEFWFGADQKIFLGRDTFRYALMYISPEKIDEVLVLETHQEYDEILRVFFSIKDIGDQEIELEEPDYDRPSKGIYILHEWGLTQDIIHIGEIGNQKGAENGRIELNSNDPSTPKYIRTNSAWDRFSRGIFWIGMSALFFLILVLGWCIYYFNKKKKEREPPKRP